MSSSAREALLQVARSPLTLGGSSKTNSNSNTALFLPNRICLAPMTRRRCPTAENLAGFPDQVEYYGRRAGYGLVFTEGTYVSHALCGTEPIPRLDDEESALGWRKVTDKVREVSSGACKMAVQIWHPGRLCTAGGLGPLDAEFVDSAGEPRKVRGLTAADLEHVAQQFATAAKLAVEVSKFDAIAIHGAHGYLLDSFLSPALNTRDDEFGGSAPADVGKRAKFPCMVVKAVRDAVGPDVPVIFRLSQWSLITVPGASDYSEIKYRTSAEFAAVIKALVASGADCLDISTRRICDPGFPEEHPTRTLAGWAKHILKTGNPATAHVPVIGVGSVCVNRIFAVRAEWTTDGEFFEFADPSPALQLLEDGEIDLLAVGRVGIGEEKFTEKLLAGQWEKINVYRPEQLGQYP